MGRVRLPAALDPLVEVGTLGADRRVEAVAREHECLARQREEAAVDRADDRVEVAAREARVADAAGEQRVAAEQHGMTLEQETRAAPRVAGRVDRVQAKIADFDHVVVRDREVVCGEHLGVLGGDTDVDTGVAHLRHRLDVIEVAVRSEDAPNAGGTRDLEQQLVLVGGVDKDCVAGALVAHHEHVVLVRSDDDLVDPHVGGLVVRRAGTHAVHPSAGPSDPGRRPEGG
jgi:hypothetical protein